MYTKRKGDRIFVPETPGYRKSSTRLRWLSGINVIIYIVIALAILFGIILLL